MPAVPLYPLFLNLKGRGVAVFGGGIIAARKIKTLLSCGARVEVVSRGYSSTLVRLSRRHPQLKLRTTRAVKSILRRVDLAFIASSDKQWNASMTEICRKQGRWVNVADRPDLCDFFSPARLQRGPLQVAISTGGASPLLARKFREELTQRLRPEAIGVLSRVGRYRKTLLRAFPSLKARRQFLELNIGKGFRFLK